MPLTIRQRIRRMVTALAGACVAVALSIAVAFVYVHDPRRGLPYEDAFARGEAEEWSAFGGTWAVSDGSMQNDSDERGAKLMSGSPYWTNYSLDADVKLLGEDGDAGLVIRSSDEENGADSYKGYYAGLRTRDNSLTLGLADHGWQEYQDAVMPEGVKAFRWYHLKVLAYGCSLVASATYPLESGHVSTIAIHLSECVKAGRIGLRSYSAGGLWRNLRVKAASEADFLAMLGNQPVHEEVSDPSYETGITIFGSGSLPSRVNPQPAQPSRDVQSISSLRLVSGARPVTATIRGVVSLTAPTLVVQDSTGGVAVVPSSGPPMKVGDEVRVTGKVETHAFSSILRDASIQLLWARTPVPPVSITPAQAATGSFAAMFVELEGTLSGKERGPQNSLILTLDARQQSFRAVVSEGRGSSTFLQLKPASLLRLRGICVVDPQYTHNLTPFVLLMRSTDDIAIVAGPPWWNTRHAVAIGFGILLLAFLSHFIYSRVERWRLRAILEERELLAHEMHDTLAQSFAGLGFQLQAIRNRMPDDMPTVHRQLDLACDLVRHSHEEARRNIMMLRSESLEPMDLGPTLKHCAQRMLEGGSVSIDASQSGGTRAIPLRINDTLFRIGQEALANAVRHARPSRIDIHVDYTEHAVRMEIADDGTGYERCSEQKGFGVKGMRRRAATISAEMKITSAPGRGTRVTVTVPLPPRLTLSTWRMYLKKRMQGGSQQGQEPYEQTRQKTYAHTDR